MTREWKENRKTNETEIFVKVNLDGKGFSDIKTDIKFLEHLLTLLAKHSLIDITVIAQGDLEHHIVEDLAIVLGQSIRKALGKKLFIRRFGSSSVPMDCSLANTVIDISNRPYSVVDLKLTNMKIEDMFSENICHFLESFGVSLRSNLHTRVLYGKNDHHKIEAAFKSLALSLRNAISIDNRIEAVPSSKGVL